MTSCFKKYNAKNIPQSTIPRFGRLIYKCKINIKLRLKLFEYKNNDII